jgi:hypothetical protein
MYPWILCKFFAEPQVPDSAVFEKLVQMQKAEILAENRKRELPNTKELSYCQQSYILSICVCKLWSRTVYGRKKCFTHHNTSDNHQKANDYVAWLKTGLQIKKENGQLISRYPWKKSLNKLQNGHAFDFKVTKTLTVILNIQKLSYP